MYINNKLKDRLTIQNSDKLSGTRLNNAAPVSDRSAMGEGSGRGVWSNSSSRAGSSRSQRDQTTRSTDLLISAASLAGGGRIDIGNTVVAGRAGFLSRHGSSVYIDAQNSSGMSTVSPSHSADSLTTISPVHGTNVIRRAAAGGSVRRQSSMEGVTREAGGLKSQYSVSFIIGETSNTSKERINRADPGERLSSRTGVAVPIICRTREERYQAPERINLDRRQLTACPHIEGEAQLKLLNYQHNVIQRIERLDNLTRLIFLDFYDNQIEKISGLDNLHSLRVLMLGKNRIKKIEGLESVQKLDVLDLHGNLIKKIENVRHLSDLRVLNLASNLIEEVRDLQGLDSLTELNLRRNNIHTVRDIEGLPNLRRLFLSFNIISSFEDVSCLADSYSLSDLCLDNNPFSLDQSYRATLLRNLQWLRELDTRRVTEDERRLAVTIGKREEEKRKEYNKITAALDKRKRAIEKAQERWEAELNRIRPLPQSHGRAWSSRENSIQEIQAVHVGNVPNSSRSADRLEPITVKSRPASAKDICTSSSKAAANSNSKRVEGGVTLERAKTVAGLHNTGSATGTKSLNTGEDSLAEIEGDTLHLYGPGSLEALDHSWGLQAAGTVSAVAFDFIDFTSIAPTLSRIRVRFPNVTSLTFATTNISTLNQLNALSSLRRLDDIYIQPTGNPIVEEFQLWKSYLLFRLSHFNIRKINGKQVTTADVALAERLFSGLAHVLSDGLTEARTTNLLGDKKKQVLSGAVKHRKAENDQSISAAVKSATSSAPVVSATSVAVASDSLRSEPISRAVLIYRAEDDDSVAQPVQDFAATRRTLSHDYTLSMISDSSRAVEKRTKLQTHWTEILTALVRGSVREMCDLEDFMRRSLSQLKTQSINT